MEADAVHVDSTFRSPLRGIFQLATVYAVPFGITIQVTSFLMTAKPKPFTRPVSATYSKSVARKQIVYKFLFIF